MKLVHELRVDTMNKLCDILDADKGWKVLGLKHMDCGLEVFNRIRRYASADSDNSPTWALLRWYSEKNETVKNLFMMFARMDHQEAMLVLKPYVGETYHKLISRISPSTVGSNLKKDITRSSVSQPFSRERDLKVPNQKVHLNASKSSVLFNCEKEFSGENSLKHPNTEDVYTVKPQNLINSKRITYAIKDLENFVPEQTRNDKGLPQHEVLSGGHEKQQFHLPSDANFNLQKNSLPDIKHIPFKDLCNATNNFDPALELGRGGFGIVYKGMWKGAFVAIKRLAVVRGSRNRSQQLVSLKQSLNELSILKCCRFDYILPLYAVSLDGVNPCVIYQLMVNGSLEDRLLCKDRSPPLTWSQRGHIAECTAKGLNYLHTAYQKPVVHGDIKSGNILLDNNMNPKIGDFGLTREGSGYDCTHLTVSKVQGTFFYLPPEYLKDRHLSPQVDVYSYGIVLLEVATGFRSYDPDRENKLLVDHVKSCHNSGNLNTLCDIKAGEEHRFWFTELINLGQICCKERKKDRPSMEQVLDLFSKVEECKKIVDKMKQNSKSIATPAESNEVTVVNPEVLEEYESSGSPSPAVAVRPAPQAVLLPILSLLQPQILDSGDVIEGTREHNDQKT